MNLDSTTLLFANAVAVFASAVYVLIHWWHARGDREAFSWGMATFGRGVAVTLLAMQAHLPEYLSTIVSPTIMIICAAEYWAAAQTFRLGFLRRRPVSLGLGIVIAAQLVAAGTGNIRLAVTMNALGAAALHAAAAVEFWLARAERLRGLWAMIFLLSLQGIAILLIAVDVNMSELFSMQPSMNAFGMINCVGLIFAVGSATSLITILKDRSEFKHKSAAQTDPLTGLANRRAIAGFLERALNSRKKDGPPISVLAFDLDGFKGINDTFGHPMGDRVLEIFADALSSAVRKNDMAGRMGGEEFALVLIDCNIDQALAVAGRVRVAFQDNARFVDGRSINATVSVGVATAPGNGSTVADIFASADIGLYRAKSLGRNRAVLSVDNPGGEPRSDLTPIA